ncbi:MAG: GTPase [Promethearchaeota archaeon]
MHIPEKKPVLAILGRSNTGKSSLCRLLAPMYKRQIKVGKAPGVTRNLLILEKEEYTIIDLPGFGYMKSVSRAAEERVKDKIIRFVEEQHSRIFLAIHVINLQVFKMIFKKYEHSSVPFDKELVEFVKEFSIPLVILANKIDKMKKSKVQEDVSYLMDKIQPGRFEGMTRDDIIPFSTRTKAGLDILEGKISSHLTTYLERA